MKCVTVMALERYRWCAIFVNLLIAHRRIGKKNNSISVSFIEGSSLWVTSTQQPQHCINCFRLNICYATKDSTQLWAQHHINNELVEISISKLCVCAAAFVVCGLTQLDCVHFIVIDRWHAGKVHGRVEHAYCVIGTHHTSLYIIIVDKTYIAVPSEHEFYNQQKLVSVWQSWLSAVSSHKLFLSFHSWNIWYSTIRKRTRLCNSGIS